MDDSATTVSQRIDKVDVTVCVCTFRRASLDVAIQSILDQALPPNLSMCISIIDNDAEPTALSRVKNFSARSRTPIYYKHAPGQNISIARNAGLDACATPWLAFMDDDEYASPDWLGSLMGARMGAHGVFGLSKAIYSDRAPFWIKAGDYHSNSPQEVPLNTGYTSNALIDMKFVRELGLRFDVKLGRSGGEDTMFFHEMYRKGAALRYAPNAIVYEEVVPARIAINWIARRKYRAGQVYALMFKTFDTTAYRRLVVLAPFKGAFCLVTSVAMVVRPSRAMWWIMRSLFHFGVVAYGIGRKIHQEYDEPR
jgi:succinoglycan biosynthesis protein ExoM